MIEGRRLRVEWPQLQKNGHGHDGEIVIPAYEAMQKDRNLGSRKLEIPLREALTRQYGAMLRWLSRWGCRGCLGQSTEALTEPEMGGRRARNMLFLSPLKALNFAADY